MIVQGILICQILENSATCISSVAPVDISKYLVGGMLFLKSVNFHQTTRCHISDCAQSRLRTSVLLCNVIVWEVASGFLSIIHISFVLQSVNAVRWVLIKRGRLINCYILDYDICFQPVCLGHLSK
jgi:hypothetical protein